MKYKVIIFDLDGVLYDSPKMVNDLFLYTYPTMTQEMMNEILCGNFHEELDKFKLTNKPREETIQEKESRLKMYQEKKRTLPLYDGMQKLLEFLFEKGYILTINTSALEKNCVPLLEYAGIAKLFDYIATKETAVSKVEKFRIIMKKYSVTPEETVFVTDTLGDVREADIAKVPTIAVTWGAHDLSYLTREPHQNVVAITSTIQELQTHLEI
jgi:phosphoglycolate phosphatase